MQSASWQYHPMELLVRPSSSESNLAWQIVEAFRRDFLAGFVRHGAGVVAQASPETRLAMGGSAPIAGLAVNGRESLFATAGHLDLPTQKILLSDTDLVVVEGCLDSPSPTVLELRPDGTGLGEAVASGARNLVALVGERRPVDKLPPGGIPWFPRDDLPGLLEHLRDLNEATLRSRPLWGILLGATISDPIWFREAATVLPSHCDRFFVDPAIARESPFGEPLENRHVRKDDLGQIMSVLEAHPGVAFLVVRPDGGPDLDERLQMLCRRRNPYRMATAYRESDTHLPVPALSIWEPKALSRIHLALAAGIHCPQKILTHSRVELLDPGTA